MYRRVENVCSARKDVWGRKRGGARRKGKMERREHVYKSIQYC
jgi:hypothetical protein